MAKGRWGGVAKTNVREDTEDEEEKRENQFQGQCHQTGREKRKLREKAEITRLSNGEE